MRRRHPSKGRTSMIEVLKQAMEVIETAIKAGDWKVDGACDPDNVIYGLRQAIAELESQEPVAWLITDEKINSLQVDSIQRLVDRARHAHMTDIKLRINGQDEWHQADWLKHLTRTTPPQRTWQGLTDEDISEIVRGTHNTGSFVRAIESKLKEKNT